MPSSTNVAKTPECFTSDLQNSKIQTSCWRRFLSTPILHCLLTKKMFPSVSKCSHVYFAFLSSFFLFFFVFVFYSFFNLFYFFSGWLCFFLPCHLDSRQFAFFPTIDPSTHHNKEATLLCSVVGRIFSFPSGCSSSVPGRYACSSSAHVWCVAGSTFVSLMHDSRQTLRCLSCWQFLPAPNPTCRAVHLQELFCSYANSRARFLQSCLPFRLGVVWSVSQKVARRLIAPRGD